MNIPVDEIIEEARKWFCRGDFKEYAKEYYYASLEYNLIDSFYWMKAGFKFDINEFEAEEEAKKYEYFEDFIKESNKYYVFSRRYKLLSNYSWLKLTDELLKIKQEIIEYSKLFRSNLEFGKSGKAYSLSRKYGWLEEMPWLYKNNKLLTDESCIKIAELYTDAVDFSENDNGAFSYAKRNGLLDKFTWLEKSPVIDKEKEVWSVYSYEFEEYKTAYVGLTRRPERRRKSHERGYSVHGRHSIVFRFAKDNNINITDDNYKLLKEGINAENAQYFEDFYKNEYLKNNWVVLNSSPTGIGIGSLGARNNIWTKERCLEAAKSCSSRWEFQKNYNSAYNSARRNGWFDEYDFWGPPLKSNEKKEIVQYSINGDLIKEYPSTAEAYRQITNKNITRGVSSSIHRVCKGEQLTAFGYVWKYKSDVLNNDGDLITKINTKLMPEDWTEEECYLEAKSCTSKLDFRNKNYRAFIASKKNGWIKSYSWFNDNVVIKKKPVIMYNLCGEFLAEFESLKEASDINKVGITEISRVCLGKRSIKTAGGFIWRFKSDVLDENGEVLKRIEVDKGDNS